MRERIKQVMRDVFGLSDIADDISQKTCGKWDSMHHLQLAVGLETEFDVSLEPEEIGEMISLNDIEKIITAIISRGN
ncbi:MAG: acyl carrier protein [Chitinispirillia bacterium]|nr:acyl carrier protein [Chitinispirillia bacterium]